VEEELVLVDGGGDSCGAHNIASFSESRCILEEGCYQQSWKDQVHCRWETCVKKTIQMGPGRLPDGSPQPFYNENGVFKGVYVEVDPDRRMLDLLSSTAETWPRLNEAVPRSGRFDTSYIVIDMSQTIVHGDKQRA